MARTIDKKVFGSPLTEIDIILKKESLDTKLDFLSYFKNDSRFLTKEHYLIIKSGIESIFGNLNSIRGEIKLEFFNFIVNHGNYISLTHSESEVESFYLSLLKPISVVDTKFPYHKLLSNTLGPLSSNYHYFSFELKNKIIKGLVYNITNSDCEGFFIINYLFFTIKLILSSKQQQQKQQQQQQHKEYLLNEENKIKEFINSETFKKIIVRELTFEDKIKKYLTFDVLKYLFDSIQQNSELYSLFLHYLKRGERLPINLKTYKKEIIESICKDENGLIFPTDNYPWKKEKISSILSLLVDNGELNLNVFKSLLNYLNDLYNDIDPQISIFEILNKESKIGLDFSIQLITLLKKEFPRLIKRKKISEFVNKLSNRMPNDFKVISVFRICEDQFINQLGQDEYILLEMYNTYFNYIIEGKESNSYYDIEFLLEDYLFYDIDKSNVKKSFIKEKFNYLIQVLNINSINHYLLPIFREKCENSEIYKLKSNYFSTITFSSSNNNNINLKLQDTLLKEIIYYYVECKSTTIFQKLQLSLVCKKFNSFVKSFINDSIQIPIHVSLSSSSSTSSSSSISSSIDKSIIENQNDLSFLLFTPSLIKNLKLNIFFGDYYLNQLLDEFESLEKLHLVLSKSTYPYTFEYLNYRLSKPQNKLKKITISFNEIPDYKDYIPLLKNKYSKEVEILIEIESICFTIQDFIKLEPSNLYPFDIGDFNEFLFDSHDYHFQDITTTTTFEDYIVGKCNIKNLKLLIDDYIGDFSENLMIPFNNTKTGELPFHILESLEFEICNVQYCTYRIIFELLTLFANKISSNLKEIIISKERLQPGSIKHQTQVILKLISNNPHYNSISKVTVRNFFSSSQEHWDSINSHSFSQSPINSSNTIEFIRQPPLPISSNSTKRKFNEIEPIINNISNQNYHDDDYDEFIINE
ncbi:hypothetical protein ACTFIW_007247 [Dictyostelium discoideum]